MGQWLAGALLKFGVTVHPVNRGDDLNRACVGLPPGTPVIIATGEATLSERLMDVPGDRVDDVVLLQNGTFNRNLAGTPVTAPTWFVVWTLRKQGLAQVTGHPTASHGRHAALLTAALAAVREPAVTIASPAECAIELATKFAFILAIGGVGRSHTGTLHAALEQRKQELRRATSECLPITLALAGAPASSDLQPLQERVLTAMNNMGSMPIRSSAAAARLQLARDFARSNDLPHAWLDSVLAND